MHLKENCALLGFFLSFFHSTGTLIRDQRVLKRNLQSKIGPFPALAKENNLSGLKKRGLYAHLLKTELSSSPEGSNLGDGQNINGGIGVGSRQGKPGYRVQLKQLKSLRKKDDIIYERDTYVPLKSKGNKATIYNQARFFTRL